jgi:hypothetical protein
MFFDLNCKVLYYNYAVFAISELPQSESGQNRNQTFPESTLVQNRIFTTETQSSPGGILTAPPTKHFSKRHSCDEYRKKASKI